MTMNLPSSLQVFADIKQCQTMVDSYGFANQDPFPSYSKLLGELPSPTVSLCASREADNTPGF